MRLRLLGTIALIVSAGTAAAQQPASTGQEGQPLPGHFRAYAVTGPRAQYMHDFVVERDLDPTVAVFALQTPTNPQDPLAVLLQKLNQFASAHKASRFGAFAIFLTLDKGFYEEPLAERQRKVGELESLNKQLTLNDLPLGLASPEQESVKQFGIVTKDDPLNASTKKHLVTVIVYNKLKVEKRFVFTEDKKLDDAAIREILAAAEKLVPAKK
jgi:hypothetical protein